jgi:nicotinamidase-related amidase
MFQGFLLQELQHMFPAEYAARIKRAGIVNAWDDDQFVSAIKNTGRKNLVMAGVTTDVCLVFPAISAVQAGYRVQAVLDAGGSPFTLSEEMARKRMADEGVILTATMTMIAELAQDWSSPEGEELKNTLFGEVLKGII